MKKHAGRMVHATMHAHAHAARDLSSFAKRVDGHVFPSKMMPRSGTRALLCTCKRYKFRVSGEGRGRVSGHSRAQISPNKPTLNEML